MNHFPRENRNKKPYKKKTNYKLTVCAWIRKN